MKTVETVSEAAIRLDDGTVFSVPRPGRHHDVIAVIRRTRAGDPVSGHRQGFVTDTGRFVQRGAALQIAEASGQLIRKTAPQDKLFSEDMW